MYFLEEIKVRKNQNQPHPQSLKVFCSEFETQELNRANGSRLRDYWLEKSFADSDVLDHISPKTYYHLCFEAGFHNFLMMSSLQNYFTLFYWSSNYDIIRRTSDQWDHNYRTNLHYDLDLMTYDAINCKTLWKRLRQKSERAGLKRQARAARFDVRLNARSTYQPPANFEDIATSSVDEYYGTDAHVLYKVSSKVTFWAVNVLNFS